MKKILLILLAALLCAPLVSCMGKDGEVSGPEDGVDSFTVSSSVSEDGKSNPFAGRWMNDFENTIFTYYNFETDGSGTIETMDLVRDFNYVYNGETVTLTIVIDSETIITQVYSYEFNGGVVTLTSGENVLVLENVELVSG